MGFDVMSRRVRVHSSTSSSPSPSSRTKSLERDKFLSKSLTPNRKHHKLLKDGSEVWSEDVEKIFVQGASVPYVQPVDGS